MIPHNTDEFIQNATHITAVGAIVSPLWLHTLSDAAAIALPLLGCGWLILQATLALYTFWKKHK